VILLENILCICEHITSHISCVVYHTYVFQTILGTPRVTDVNVLLRILQDGDLRCKTEHSTTFLHESVKYNLPAQFVAKLLTLDVPIEERDRNALTARELALKNNRHELVQV